MSEWTEWRSHRPGDPCPIKPDYQGHYMLRFWRGYGRPVQETRYDDEPNSWDWTSFVDKPIIAYRIKETREDE